MNLYYFTPKDVWLKNLHSFHPSLGSHYLDLDAGWILLSAHFLDHSGLEHWESQQGVIPLPHPIFQGNAPIVKQHAALLSPLGVKEGQTVIDIAKIVGDIHPQMKLRAI